ncbi:MAG: sigma-70 family RNA polymerase sigma factor [bacterium]|nr:sigma-70 family RNA polymerase sigma factor [bacterium]
MEQFNQLLELEAKLKACRLSDQQRTLMRSLLGFNGESLLSFETSARRAWPGMESVSDSILLSRAKAFRGQSLEKIQSALTLSKSAFMMLGFLDRFYKELETNFPALDYAEIESLALGRGRSKGKRVNGKKPGNNEIEMPIKSLGRLPLDLPPHLAEELRRKRGEDMSQAMFRIFKLYSQTENGEGEMIFKGLIELNIPFVFKLSRKYEWRFKHDPALQFFDLIQAGVVGLIEAIKRYDYTRGFTFASYAQWWINQAFRIFIAEAGTVRVPIKTKDNLYKIFKNNDRLRRSLEREPTEEETQASLGEEINVSDAIIKDAMLVAKRISFDEAFSPDADPDVRAKLGALPPDKVDEAAGITVASSNSNGSGEANIDDLDFKAKIRELILAPKLSAQEQEVLRLRFFGENDDGDGLTLDQIGRIMNFSRERIRQIETKAKNKLRAGETGKRLRELRPNLSD